MIFLFFSLLITIGMTACSSKEALSEITDDVVKKDRGVDIEVKPLEKDKD